MDKGETKQAGQDVSRIAMQKATERARVARWDLDIAVFLFAVLIIVLILLFQGIGVEIVGPVAAVGLALVWLIGWRKGKQLYSRFYNEELSRLNAQEKTDEESVEEKVRVALRKIER